MLDTKNTIRQPSQYKKLTKQDFDQSPIKELILNKGDIMFILITGSGMSNIIDKYSDIDLLVVYYTLYNPGETPKVGNGLGDGIHTHALGVSYDNFFHNHYTTGIKSVQGSGCFLGFNNGSDDCCIYLNDLYIKEYQDIINNKEQIIDYGIQNSLYGLIQKNKLFYNIRPTKFLCNMAYIKMILNKEKIDQAYLLALKRSRYVPLNNEYISRIEADKMGLKIYLDKYPLNNLLLLEQFMKGLLSCEQNIN